MQTRSFTYFIACALCLAACKKEDVSNSVASLALERTSSQATGSFLAEEDTTYKWYGFYFVTTRPGDPDPGLDPDANLLDESLLIKDGIAQIKEPGGILILKSPTTIEYEIPASQNISGDSVVLEATMQNKDNVVSFSMREYVVHGIGAGVIFNAPVNNVGTYEMFCGGAKKTITIKPAIDFTKYQTVQFAIKGNKAYLLRNNVVLASMSIRASDKPSRIGFIGIGDESVVSCDRVRLLNSFTRKVRMREDFNIDGQSNTLFY